MPHPPSRVRPPLLTALAVVAALVAVLALLVPLYAAPGANLGPRDLPVAVAGPGASGFADKLVHLEPGAFEVTELPDAAAADQAIRDREVYASFITGPDGVTLHTAPGASPTVALLLSQAIGQLSPGQPPRVVEVVPGDPDDPRGAGLAGGFLPLALVSLAAGALLARLVAGRGARLIGLLSYGLLAGLAGVAVLHGWLGVLPGSYLLDAGALGLFALATAATVTGLVTLLGPIGLGTSVLAVFLVGNPISAVTSAPELLPQPWGAVGQWLPVGAGNTLLRSTSFFDGAGAGLPLAVLSGYSLIGLTLVLIGRIRAH